MPIPESTKLSLCKQESLERKIVGNYAKDTGKTSAKKDLLLGNSKEEEKGKELGIQTKTVRKRKGQAQGNDGINRLSKISKLGQSVLMKIKGLSSMAAKGREGQLIFEHW